MYFKDCFTTFKIRKFYRYTAVETSRTGQCRVKRFRTVGCCQNNNTVISLKTIHLRKQLVQGLLTFIVSTCHLSVTFLTNGIDLINEYDTRCFFLCLFKEVTNFGCAHTNKHFHKFRTGHREERYIGFTGYCFCQHGFTGTWRAYKENAFRHGGSHVCVFLWVMKVIYNLCKVFLGFILSGYI